jgi:NO-binding membrane sensor protein with MHYT domain/nitrogen-specific signal transduction histidine kinase
MYGTYDTWLVGLSYFVAVIASYVALVLAARVAATSGSSTSRYWLIGGALSMGSGIWSMHFIGMLAFRLPIPMSYNIPITVLSLLIAGVVSGFALYTVSRRSLSTGRLACAGLLMGLGIAAMHYTGMAAMEMEPPIRYSPLLFILSIAIAIVASLAALWIAFQLRTETFVSAFWKRAGAAMIMGAAICGMHYTAMAAAIFAPNSVCTLNPQDINNVWLATSIGGFTFMLLMTTLLISVFDARLTTGAASLEAADAASAMKDQFLATLSHELRTPLSAIVGWLHALKPLAANHPELKQGLDAIERNARVQTQLIEDLLDMSRITAGKVRLDMQPLEPISFIEAAIETVSPAADAKHVRLERQLDPQAGPITGDPRRLQQVIWNLLANSIKFTPKEGTVKVLLERVNSHVEITIADTGIGIRPEFVPHVFERFRQGDASDSERPFGLGLGLAIVKHFVELHGGTVSASSPGEGHGTTFAVRLPLVVAHKQAL